MEGFFFFFIDDGFFVSYIKLYHFETGQSNEIIMTNKLPCFEVRNLMRQPTIIESGVFLGVI